MGYLVRLGLGVALLSWSGLATAESAPASPQWSAPAPPPGTAAPSASAPPTPAPPAAVSPPAPVSNAPAPPVAAPPSAPPAAPAPYPYPYPYPYQYPYPPPPGYGYYYPAPELPKPRYPNDSAVRTTPFIEALVLGVSWENRFSQFLCLGAQAGVYVGGRVRLTLRGAIPTNNLNDEYYPRQGADVRSKNASLLLGASAGVVAVSTHNFVMSPGVAFAFTDVSDYGSMLALSMPLEWVTDNGVRWGFEVDLGRAFAGHTRLTNCSGGVCAGAAPQDRPAGTAFLMQFQIGYGFNHPAPLPPEPAPRSAPAPR